MSIYDLHMYLCIYHNFSLFYLTIYSYINVCVYYVVICVILFLNFIVLGFKDLHILLCVVMYNFASNYCIIFQHVDAACFVHLFSRVGQPNCLQLLIFTNIARRTSFADVLCKLH